MERDQLISALKALPDEDLVNVMSQVLPLRQPYDYEPSVVSSRMFLGIYVVDEQPAPHISAIAYPKHQELGPDHGFCQWADSNIEGVGFVSNCKHCVSPFDDQAIYLT